MQPFTVKSLRKEMGLTQEEFSRRVGLNSGGRLSCVERGIAPCPLRVALKIESLSDGRIDAADLCDDVKLARHGKRFTSATATPSNGKPTQISAAPNTIGAAQ